MVELNSAVKYGQAINNGYPGPMLRLTPNRHADKELLWFAIQGINMARDMLYEVSSVLLEPFIEISAPELDSPFMGEEGANFAKALIETVAYENAMLGATPENPLPILQHGIGIAGEIVIRLLSDILCRKPNGLNGVNNPESYQAKARLAVEQAVKASQFFTLSKERRNQTYQDFHSRIAERPSATVQGTTQVLSSLNHEQPLQSITGRLTIPEETVAIDDYERGLFPDVVTTLAANDSAVLQAADNHHRASRIVEKKKIQTGDDNAIVPKLKPLTLTNGIMDLLAKSKPEEIIDTAALEEQAIYETTTLDNTHSIEKETDMYQGNQNAIQVMDVLYNRPILTQNNQPLVMNANEAPKVPVTHAMNGQNMPEFMINGLPVLMFNDSYNGQSSWTEWTPQVEAQWIDYGIRNGFLNNPAPQPQAARPMGYREQQMAQARPAAGPVYQPVAATRPTGAYQSLSQHTEVSTEVPASAAMRQSIPAQQPATAPVARPAAHNMASAITTQPVVVTTPSPRDVLPGSYPVELHDGTVIYAVDAAQAPFRAVGNKGFPVQLGKMGQELCVIVGMDEDFNVYEVLIDKEKWMDREDHLGQFERAIRLESHEGTVAEIAVAEEEGTPKSFSVVLNDSIGTADGYKSMAAMELASAENDTELKLTKFEITRPIPAIAIPYGVLKRFVDTLATVEETKDSDTPLYYSTVCVGLMDELRELGNTSMFTFLDEVITHIALTAIRYRVSAPAPTATLTSFFESKDDIVSWAVERDINVELFNILEEELPKYFSFLNETEAEDEEGAIEGAVTVQCLQPWVMAVDEDEVVPLGRITYGSFPSLYRAIDGAFAKLTGNDTSSTITVVTQKGEILEMLRVGDRIPCYYCTSKL